MNPEAAKVAVDSSGELLKLGIAGVFIIFCIAIIWFLWSALEKQKVQLIKSHSDRAEDAEKYAASLLDVVKETTKTVQQQSVISSAVAAAVETSNRSNEGRTASIDRLTHQMEGFGRDLNGLRNSCGVRG